MLKTYKQASVPRDPGSMPYIQVAPGGRYFMTEDGRPFLVVGHNDAMPWPTLHHMRNEADLHVTEAYIQDLARRGVTVLRIMLEYCQDNKWFFEKPVGNVRPEAVQYWDNLIGLCERHKMRLLILFWDTFFMSRRWKHHPYSRPGSGFSSPGCLCAEPLAMEVEKARIRFFIERWGNSPAIFAYDLLNEIHPHWGGTPEEQSRWVSEMARFIREGEMELWGKRHLLTLSVFGSKPEGGYSDLILRHPDLDFVTTHVYELGMVDNPNNTVDCAFVMRDAVRHAFAEMTHVRPYTDTESGPIHLFMDRKKQLDPEFETEYYHNMSWAHLATGGAGSGMRWPFRHPHRLTDEMHDVQEAMARFIAAASIDWLHFSPRPVDHLLAVGPAGGGGGQQKQTIPFGCSDGRQALVWLLRDSRKARKGRSKPQPLLEATEYEAPLMLHLPTMEPGRYAIEFWDTYKGEKCAASHITVPADATEATIPLPPFSLDLAITITPSESEQD
jgi:hypothetical protein